ncbi:MAG: hypothetical protein N2485_05950 [bacterium]|nr:hypothetical protein [bacterium]
MKKNVLKLVKLFSFILLILVPSSFFLFLYFSNYTYKFNSKTLNYKLLVKDFNNFYIDINIDLSKYTKDEIYTAIFKLLKREKKKPENVYEQFNTYIYNELNKNSLNYPDTFLFFNEIINTQINKNYFLKYYFNILKILNKNKINLYIRVNLYNLKNFKKNLYDVINEKILVNENEKLFFEKLGGIALFNFFPDDYLENIDAVVIIKLNYLKKQNNFIIENIDFKMKNKYLKITALFNPEKANIDFYSIVNNINLINDFKIYNFSYHFRFNSFPVFNITFKLNLPFLFLKNNYYSISLKNLNTYLNFIFKDEFNFNFSFKELIFYNNNNRISKVNINSLNLNLLFYFNDFIVSKINIDKIIFNSLNNKSNFLNNTKLFLRIFFNKNFDNSIENKFVIFGDIININFNNNLKFNFKDIICYINNIDYNKRYFDLDFASKDYKFSLNLKNNKFNFLYLLDSEDYGVISNDNDNFFGILNFSILKVYHFLSILKDNHTLFSFNNIDRIFNFINKNFIKESEKGFIVFKDIHKNRPQRTFKNYFSKYAFAILFPKIFFNGYLDFYNVNNYSLNAIYAFYDIKKLYTNYINDRFFNLSNLDLIHNSILFGNVYLNKINKNFDFSIISFLFNNEDIFNNFFVSFYFKINNFKFDSLNIIANIFNNYFSIFSNDFRYFNIFGNIFNFNNLVLLDKQFFSNNLNIKELSFDFSLDFNILSKSVSNFYIFIDKLSLVYNLNKKTNDYLYVLLNNLFIKINKNINFVAINHLVSSNIINTIKILADWTFFNNKVMFIGNLNMNYYYNKNLEKIKMFANKILNNNIDIFINIDDSLNDLNINIVLSALNKNDNYYIFNGIICFLNEFFLVKNVISYFDIRINLNYNSFLINFADFKGNFLLNTLLNNIKKEYLFNFSLNIQKKNDNYLTNLFLGYNLVNNIDFIKLNFITTLNVNDIQKDINNIISLFKLKNSREISKFIYKSNFLSNINKIWEKTYFNLTFDSYFFDILNYLKNNYNLQFLKFMYLKEYNAKLIKTSEFFLFKINSISDNNINDNNIIGLDFNLSSDKKNTFLYLNYFFDKMKLLDISLKIKNYSLLYIPNLLAINNKNINLSINLYPFSLVLMNLYSNILFDTNFEFFYNLTNDFYNENDSMYNKSVLSFDFDGTIFIDNLKRINEIKINSIIFNVNLNNLYIFSFKEFKIIDFNLNSNLNLKFDSLYINLSEITNKEKLYEIFNKFIGSNTFLNFNIDFRFYFANLSPLEFSLEPVYLASFNSVNITLLQNKYLCNLNINLPFALFKIIPYFKKYYQLLNSNNNDSLNEFLNSIFISFSLKNFYIDKNAINFNKKDSLFSILELILYEYKIKLNALLFYYNYEFNFNMFLSKDYNLNLKIDLFENSKNIGYVNFNDLPLKKIMSNGMNFSQILRNTEAFINDFDLLKEFLNSTGNFNLIFRNYNLTINFKQFNFKYMNNNTKIDGNLSVNFENNYFYFEKIPAIFINNSIVNYTINTNNGETLLSFNIDLKNINAGIFNYKGNANFNGSILFKNNRLEISIFSSINKGELQIMKSTSKNKKLFLYNYITKLNVRINGKNIRNRNIIWDVKFDSNLDINLKQMKINGNLKINKGTLRLNDGIYRIIQGNINWDNNLYGDMYILAQKLGTTPFDYKLTFVKGNLKDFIISNFNLYQDEKNLQEFNLSNINNLSSSLSFGLNDFMGLDIIDYSNNKTIGYIRVGKEIIKNIFVFYLRKLNKSNFENLDYDYYISVDYLIKRFSKGVLLINSTFYNNSKTNFGFIFVYGF